MVLLCVYYCDDDWRQNCVCKNNSISHALGQLHDSSIINRNALHAFFYFYTIFFLLLVLSSHLRFVKINQTVLIERTAVIMDGSRHSASVLLLANI